MILDIDKGEHLKRENIDIHSLPNGATAVLDDDGGLIAYNKIGDPDGNHWDWVRKDFQK